MTREDREAIESITPEDAWDALQAVFAERGNAIPEYIIAFVPEAMMMEYTERLMREHGVDPAMRIVFERGFAHVRSKHRRN